MSNPVMVIIGAGPGMGLAVARRFASAGYDIGLIGRDAGKTEELAGTLEREGAQVGWAAVDVADAPELTAVLRRMTEHTGRLDVLLFNPSAFRACTATQVTAADLLADLAVGTAPLLTAVQAVLPLLREQHTGTVLATGSGAADTPSPGAASLGPQKAALRSLVQELAVELGAAGIHVATVTVHGNLKEGTPFAPSLIAETFFALVEQTHGDPAKWETVVDYRG
jgi:NADP-dependent 3-hydroxy acid dehydrogenase YdfG